MAVTPAHPAGESASFAEVMGAPAGGILLAVGTVSAGPRGGASEAVAAGRGVMHAASTHGSSPSEVLDMLGSSMRSQPTGTWASGVAATLHLNTGALEIAQAGAAAVVMLGREGRVHLVLPDTAPVGTGHVRPPSQLHLALPGDRVALLSGRVSALADPRCLYEAELALASLSDNGGTETARALLSLVCADDVAAAVSVLEVAEEHPEAPPFVAT